MGNSVCPIVSKAVESATFNNPKIKAKVQKALSHGVKEVHYSDGRVEATGIDAFKNKYTVTVRPDGKIFFSASCGAARQQLEVTSYDLRGRRVLSYPTLQNRACVMDQSNVFAGRSESYAIANSIVGLMTYLGAAILNTLTAPAAAVPTAYAGESSPK